MRSGVHDKKSALFNLLVEHFGRVCEEGTEREREGNGFESQNFKIDFDMRTGYYIRGDGREEQLCNMGAEGK